ncbi:ALDH-like protein [Dipodascopsis uninucleata]
MLQQFRNQEAVLTYTPWSLKQTLAQERREIILKAASIMKRRAEEIINAQVLETGVSKEWAALTIEWGIGTLEEIACDISSVISGEIPNSLERDTVAMVFKEPTGPVLTIAPWNPPAILGTRAVVSPIAAGCSVILKSSELCPQTLYLLGEIFAEAGLPKGVLNIIQSDRTYAGAVTEAIIAHPSIRKVDFIGSAAIGKVIGQLAAKYLKPIKLELGGKCAAIVLEDADLEDAARKCMTGAILHHGQLCFSTERIIVHQSVADKFIDILKSEAKKVNIGVAASPRLLQNISHMMEEATSNGAVYVIGEPRKINDVFAGPVVLKDVTRKFIWAYLMIHIAEDEEDAIRLCNDSSYGLSGAVHSLNVPRAIAVAKKLELGQVHINSMTVRDSPTWPMGGVKGSGWGRSNAKWSIQEYLQEKLVTFSVNTLSSI